MMRKYCALNLHISPTEVILAIVIVMAVIFCYLLYAVPREAKRESDFVQARGAKAFHFYCSAVNGRTRENADAEELHPSAYLSAWRSELPQAYAYKFVAPSDTDRNNIDQYYFCISDSPLNDLWVAIPTGDAVAGYVAACLVVSNVRDVRVLRVLAYSPSSPEHIYITRVDSRIHAERVVARLFDRLTWDSPFQPASDDWPYFYRIGRNELGKHRIKHLMNKRE